MSAAAAAATAAPQPPPPRLSRATAGPLMAAGGRGARGWSKKPALEGKKRICPEKQKKVLRVKIGHRCRTRLGLSEPGGQGPQGGRSDYDSDMGTGRAEGREDMHIPTQKQEVGRIPFRSRLP